MTNTANLIKKYTELDNAQQMVEAGEVLQDLKNLPPQISVEAVKELREKYKCWDNPSERCIIDDLNILLSKQQQDDTTSM